MNLVVAVASGKGGTGKTTIATSLALAQGAGVQLLDCDVEEPNAHIFLDPAIETTAPVSIPVPRIDKTLCDFCGKCARVCAFNALAVLKDDVLVFDNLCHGCGGCRRFCPRAAITEVDREIGRVETGRAGAIGFARGVLNVGEAMAPPLIRAVKRRAAAQGLVIIDAPPGTSCPVIEAVRDSHFCILVTEPTPFGLNDLVLAAAVVRQLGIPMGVVVNRHDPGFGKIDEFCAAERIPVLLRIPFDRRVAVAYSRGIPLLSARKDLAEPLLVMLDSIRKLSPAGHKRTA